MYISTIGVEYKIKKITLNGIDITLQFWDTAGQERYHTITHNFLKGADRIIFIYDITNRSSFDNIREWILKLKECTENIKKIVVGNKADLENLRLVPKERLQKFCSHANIKGIEVSAKNGDNVNEAFELLVGSIIEGQSKEQFIEKYSEMGRAKGKTTISKDLHKKKGKKNVFNLRLLKCLTLYLNN